MDEENTPMLYVKKGRRYKPFGREFTGWPANGYWEVKDGRSSLLVPLDDPDPLPKLQYLQYREAVISDLINELKKRGSHSYLDIVEIVLLSLQKRLEENDQ